MPWNRGCSALCRGDDALRSWARAGGFHPMRTRTAFAAASLLCTFVHIASSAQDDTAKPAPKADPPQEKAAAPAEQPKADPAAAEKPAAEVAAAMASDRKARDILMKAAERQNAGDLAEPGKLQS